MNNLNYFASSSYGFCASILIPNYELALAIILEKFLASKIEMYSIYELALAYHSRYR